MIDTLFDQKYFAEYERKGICGGAEKPYWYGFWVRFLSQRIPSHGRILDCGCGAGFFLRRLHSYYAVGLDVSIYALALAQKNAPHSCLVGARVEQIPFSDSSFDAIASFEVIEHLVSPEIFIQEISRILRPGGYWVFSTPNPQSFGAHVKKRRPEWYGKPEYERRAEWHGWRDDSHINIRTIDEWRMLVRQNGFVIERDGTGALNDIPYFETVPLILQKLVFSSTWIILSATLGFLPWRWGETYMCCARKNTSSGQLKLC